MYALKKGSRFTISDTDIQLIGKSIDKLVSQYGNAEGLVAHKIVEDAQDTNSVFHTIIYAETDKEAATTRRLQLASQLVCHIINVDITIEKGRVTELRAFPQATIHNQSGFLLETVSITQDKMDDLKNDQRAGYRTSLIKNVYSKYRQLLAFPELDYLTDAIMKAVKEFKI
jgi:hypothetical protein